MYLRSGEEGGKAFRDVGASRLEEELGRDAQGSSLWPVSFRTAACARQGVLVCCH